MPSCPTRLPKKACPSVFCIDNAANFHLSSLHRMANYQPAIAKLLHSPTGAVFEQDLHQPDFVAVSDWEIPQE